MGNYGKIMEKMEKSSINGNVSGEIMELNGGFSTRNWGRGHAILVMVSQVPVPMEGWEHVVIT